MIAAAFYYLIFHDRLDFGCVDFSCYSPNHEFHILGKTSVTENSASGF
jgi:hypothetical protein